MSILENTNRVGNFTSSKIFNLMTEGTIKGTFGAKALTYIEEKRFERDLKRSISTEVETKPILWGKFLEPFVNELLPITYQHVGDVTLNHPKYDFWVGSPDFTEFTKQFRKVCDLKCPQPKAFCQLIKNLTKAKKTGNIKYFKDNHPDYFYQLVSNAIITKSDLMELIIYMPYESELPAIRMAAENFEGLDQYKYRFIAESSKYQLAYLPDNSAYQNLNLFTFEVPRIECINLEGRVVKGHKELLLAA